MFRYSDNNDESEKYLEMKKQLIEKMKPDEIKYFSGKEEAYRFRDIEFKSKDELMVDSYYSLSYLYSSMGKYEQSIKINKKTMIPFGPFLIFGTILAWFWGDFIIKFLISLSKYVLKYPL